MNKKDLVKSISVSTGYDKKDVETVVNEVFDQISGALSEGAEVNIPGFGKFSVKDRAARDGVNPKLLKDLKEQGFNEEEAKKQAKVSIPASKAPALKFAKAVRDAVNV